MVKGYRFIGTSCVAFEYGCIYEAEKTTEVFGECYSIKDESGEWYIYGISFFEQNFVEVFEEKGR